MKWLLRIIETLLLLAALAAFGAWLAFPWYAQALIDRATVGKGIAVKLHSPGRPELSGIGFDRLDATIRIKPDSCVTAPAAFTLKLLNGRLSWKRIAGSATPTFGMQLDADSVEVLQNPSEIRFRQAKPRLRARLDLLPSGGILPSIAPDSITVAFRNGQAEAGQLRIENISYDVLLTRSHKWVQQPALFRAESLFSGSTKTPLSSFEATFGLQRHPGKPCTLTFSNCSLQLSGIKASTPKIEFNLRNKRTAFVLKLDNAPLDQFSPDSGPASLTGKLSGSIPVEYLDSTIRISNGSIDAAKGTAFTFKTKGTKISFEAGRKPGEPQLIENLNAKITLDGTNGTVSVIRLDSVSARLFGSRIASTPTRYDLKSGATAATISIDRAPILDRIRLTGEFSGSMNGRLSGTIPVRLDRNGIAISNARLSAQGGGSIRQKLPKQPSGTDELFSKTASSEVLWDVTDPTVTLNREAAGKLTMEVALKSLKRKTGSGELLLTSPKGTLTMFARPAKPSLVSVSDFSAGLLDGTVAVKQMDYDLEKKHTETLVQLNGIPIQSLLDLQGASKLSATGTIRGAIPVVLDNNAFSIPDGSMNAEKSGLIIYASTPEERAAAGAGMRLTYEALGNFFYSELVSTIAMTPDGNSTISIQLKGRNPDFQNNRPVSLNLNIQQNLLDLFRSLTLSSDIEEAISKKALEKSQKK
ncbi:YdbH domain-containing protein [Chlorobaculum sp. MV4-Y]|uniref:YdbH domain-containing protein n=1 Tax=Chlorobaculum sp. MV4-Y TaxID=2976335 RepID=UPI0021AEA72C|nr:YdbH domain-containing protein [Chlorobaculum sp. MV4-Y]UWX57150.1 YdbH domain-containing protein [Chlorobaculum sp. MV4-Y]